MNGGQYEERKKQKQAKENKKQAPMDCDCCYRNSRGNFCSMRGRVLSYAGETCSCYHEFGITMEKVTHIFDIVTC